MYKVKVRYHPNYKGEETANDLFAGVEEWMFKGSDPEFLWLFKKDNSDIALINTRDIVSVAFIEEEE